MEKALPLIHALATELSNDTDSVIPSPFLTTGPGKRALKPKAPLADRFELQTKLDFSPAEAKPPDSLAKAAASTSSRCSTRRKPQPKASSPEPEEPEPTLEPEDPPPSIASTTRADGPAPAKPPAGPAARAPRSGRAKPAPTPSASTAKGVSPKGKSPAKSPHSGNVNKKNGKGETPLQRACIKGDLEEARRLVGLDADVNTKDNAQWTPLHEVCSRGFTGVAAFLVESNADINAQSSTNTSPLHDAVVAGQTDIIELLLENGADTAAVDDEGRTPADVTEDEALRCLLAEGSINPALSETSELKASELTEEEDGAEEHVPVSEKRLGTHTRSVVPASLSKASMESGTRSSLRGPGGPKATASRQATNTRSARASARESAAEAAEIVQALAAVAATEAATAPTETSPGCDAAARPPRRAAAAAMAATPKVSTEVESIETPVVEDSSDDLEDDDDDDGSFRPRPSSRAAAVLSAVNAKPKRTPKPQAKPVIEDLDSGESDESDDVGQACNMCGVDDDADGLICDACDGVYHLTCLKRRKAPPGDADWFCESCADKPDASPIAAESLPAVDDPIALSDGDGVDDGIDESDSNDATEVEEMEAEAVEQVRPAFVGMQVSVDADETQPFRKPVARESAHRSKEPDITAAIDETQPVQLAGERQMSEAANRSGDGPHAVNASEDEDRPDVPASKSAAEQAPEATDDAAGATGVDSACAEEKKDDEDDEDDAEEAPAPVDMRSGHSDAEETSKNTAAYVDETQFAQSQHSPGPVRLSPARTSNTVVAESQYQAEPAEWNVMDLPTEQLRQPIAEAASRTATSAERKRKSPRAAVGTLDAASPDDKSGTPKRAKKTPEKLEGDADCIEAAGAAVMVGGVSPTGKRTRTSPRGTDVGALQRPALEDYDDESSEDDGPVAPGRSGMAKKNLSLKKAAKKRRTVASDTDEEDDEDPPANHHTVPEPPEPPSLRRVVLRRQMSAVINRRETQPSLSVLEDSANQESVNQKAGIDASDDSSDGELLDDPVLHGKKPSESPAPQKESEASSAKESVSLLHHSEDTPPRDDLMTSRRPRSVASNDSVPLPIMPCTPEDNAKRSPPAMRTSSSTSRTTEAATAAAAADVSPKSDCGAAVTTPTSDHAKSSVSNESGSLEDHSMDSQQIAERLKAMESEMEALQEEHEALPDTQSAAIEDECGFSQRQPGVKVVGSPDSARSAGSTTGRTNASPAARTTPSSARRIDYAQTSPMPGPAVAATAPGSIGKTANHASPPPSPQESTSKSKSASPEAASAAAVSAALGTFPAAQSMAKSPSPMDMESASIPVREMSPSPEPPVPTASAAEVSASAPELAASAPCTAFGPSPDERCQVSSQARRSVVVLMTGLGSKAKRTQKKFRGMLQNLEGDHRIVLEFDSTVTHIVTAVEKDSLIAQRRTMKLMRGIAEGKWIVGIEWAERCLKEKKFVREDDFEAVASGTDSDVVPQGPQRSRLAFARGERLLNGWKVFPTDHPEGVDPAELAALITTLGGQVLSAAPTEPDPDGRTVIIVGGDSVRYDDRDDECDCVPVCEFEYLFDCITSYSVLPCEDYLFLEVGYEEDCSQELL